MAKVLAEVTAAYWDARGRAMGLSTWRLRRAERRVRCRSGRLSQVELAKLRAFHLEMQTRGLDVPGAS
jgi:hypothetical protein